VIAFASTARADFTVTVTELDASNNTVATGFASTPGQILTPSGTVGDFTVSVSGTSNSGSFTTSGMVSNVTIDIAAVGSAVTTGYTLRLVLQDDRFTGNVGVGGILANSISTTSQPSDGSASTFGFLNGTSTSTVTVSGLVQPLPPGPFFASANSSTSLTLSTSPYTLGNEVDIHMNSGEQSQYTITTQWSQVPEPASTVLLLSAAPLLAGLYWRRRKQLQVA
jgi:hypothetical protein